MSKSNSEVEVISIVSKFDFWVVNNGVTTELTIPLYSTQGKQANEVIDDMYLNLIFEFAGFYFPQVQLLNLFQTL